MHVMVLEDDPDLVDLYKQNLPHGWFIETFQNTREAFYQYLKSPHTYDLVICDLTNVAQKDEAFIFDIKVINAFQRIVVVATDSSSLNLPAHFGVKIYHKPILMQDVLRKSFADKVAA